MRPGTDQATTRRLLNVHEAAEHLGLTVEAVRSRIKRGTLAKERDPDGTVYVVYEEGAGLGHDRARPGGDQSNDQAAAQPLIVTRLENEVEWLRREVERKDTIIMSLSQSIAALEAPPEPRDSPVTVTEETDKGTAPTEQEPSQQRSWLYRFFYGPQK